MENIYKNMLNKNLEENRFKWNYGKRCYAKALTVPEI